MLRKLWTCGALFFFPFFLLLLLLASLPRLEGAQGAAPASVPGTEVSCPPSSWAQDPSDTLLQAAEYCGDARRHRREGTRNRKRPIRMNRMRSLGSLTCFISCLTCVLYLGRGINDPNEGHSATSVSGSNHRGLNCWTSHCFSRHTPGSLHMHGLFLYIGQVQIQLKVPNLMDLFFFLLT